LTTENNNFVYFLDLLQEEGFVSKENGLFLFIETHKLFESKKGKILTENTLNVTKSNYKNIKDITAPKMSNRIEK